MGTRGLPLGLVVHIELSEEQLQSHANYPYLALLQFLPELGSRLLGQGTEVSVLAVLGAKRCELAGNLLDVCLTHVCGFSL